ncbi:hypothetical protein DFH09DRAFT_1081492 [Mycena vulgaris]|nr:hypothetical protein DFH09DRAFT_1081492 [Mycena vulgaris]
MTALIALSSRCRRFLFPLSFSALFLFNYIVVRSDSETYKDTNDQLAQLLHHLPPPGTPKTCPPNARLPRSTSKQSVLGLSKEAAPTTSAVSNLTSPIAPNSTTLFCALSSSTGRTPTVGRHC